MTGLAEYIYFKQGAVDFFSFSRWARFSVLLLFTIYLMKNIRIGKSYAIIPLLLLFFLNAESLVHAFQHQNFSFLYKDLISTNKYAFVFVVSGTLMTLLRKQEIEKRLLQRLLLWVAAIFVIAIWLPWCLRVSVWSVRGTFGSTGLIEAGNDLGIVLLITLPFVYIDILIKRQHLSSIVLFFVFLISLLMISTRAAIIGFAIMVFIMPIIFFVLCKKDRGRFQLNFVFNISIVLLLAATFLIYYYYNQKQLEFLGGGFTRLQYQGLYPSGRLERASFSMELFRNSSIMEYILGIGFTKMATEIAKGFTAIPSLMSNEMDGFDILLSLGIIGIFLILIPYFVYLRKILANLKVDRYYGVPALLSFLLYVSHGLAAGHAFGSAMVGTTFGIILGLGAYSNSYGNRKWS